MRAVLVVVSIALVAAFGAPLAGPAVAKRALNPLSICGNVTGANWTFWTAPVRR